MTIAVDLGRKATKQTNKTKETMGSILNKNQYRSQCDMDDILAEKALQMMVL